MSKKKKELNPNFFHYNETHRVYRLCTIMLDLYVFKF